ncbi:MAG: sigma-70 family RNA polymerase sigma factor [Blautia sp.]|nr:sigma-70 family RNA polymerase sigma factor [Blautia sp.]
MLVMVETPEDKRKFTVMYENYRHLMHKVAWNVLHDDYLAEDAVHNAFIHLAKNMDKIEDPMSISTKRYLIVLVKNSAIDIYRKRSRQMKKEIFVDELQEGETVTYMETGMDNRVLDILKNLPVKYRDIFLLKYSAHMNNAEIAGLCGIREGTVRQRIARGKVMVEDELKKLEMD